MEDYRKERIVNRTERRRKIRNEIQEHDTSEITGDNVGVPANPLKNLDNSFRRAKAEQIIKFLKDQEELTRRFTQCKLSQDEGDSSDYSSGDESVLEGRVTPSNAQGVDSLELCDIEDDILSDCGSSVTSMCSDNTTAGDLQEIFTERTERRRPQFSRKLARPRTTIGFSRPPMTNLNFPTSTKSSASADPRTRIQREDSTRRPHHKDSGYLGHNTLNVPADELASSRSYHGGRLKNKLTDLSICDTQRFLNKDFKPLRIDNDVDSVGIRNIRLPGRTEPKIASVVRFPPLGGAKPKNSKNSFESITNTDTSMSYRSKRTSSFAETPAH